MTANSLAHLTPVAHPHSSPGERAAQVLNLLMTPKLWVWPLSGGAGPTSLWFREPFPHLLVSFGGR